MSLVREEAERVRGGRGETAGAEEVVVGYRTDRIGKIRSVIV